MASGHKTLLPERLQARLAALKARIAPLPAATRREFQPLVEDLEIQMKRSRRDRDALRRLRDEMRAIDKCVRFELVVLLPDALDEKTHSLSECQPRLRSDFPGPLVPPHAPRQFGAGTHASRD
jgi:hypothetical protein